jgi:hypothetical protein
VKRKKKNKGTIHSSPEKCLRCVLCGWISGSLLTLDTRSELMNKHAEFQFYLRSEAIQNVK